MFLLSPAKSPSKIRCDHARKTRRWKSQEALLLTTPSPHPPWTSQHLPGAAPLTCFWTCWCLPVMQMVPTPRPSTHRAAHQPAQHLSKYCYRVPLEVVHSMSRLNLSEMEAKRGLVVFSRRSPSIVQGQYVFMQFADTDLHLAPWLVLALSLCQSTTLHLFRHAYAHDQEEGTSSATWFPPSKVMSACLRVESWSGARLPHVLWFTVLQHNSAPPQHSFVCFFCNGTHHLINKGFSLSII